jgi:MoaA/NifB/PqqE/SkfB family radical SAM enzyme
MFKLFSNFNALLFSKIFKINRPIIVHLNVTNRCNLKCTYCYNIGNKEKEMAFEDYKKLIDIFSSAGTVKITLIGGEPFSRKDISCLAEYAKKRIRYVFITTNGLFSIKDNSALITSLDGISFSINDAFEVGYWPEIAKNIKSARHFNNTVSMSCILTKSNCKHLNEILIFAASNDIGVYFTPVIDPSKPMHHNVQKEFQLIVKAKHEGQPVIDSFSYLEGLNKLNLSKKCYAGQLFFAVNTNGDLYPCLNFIGQEQYVIDNMFQSDFMFDAIRSSKYCTRCCWNCHEEANYLFSFKPEAILNLFKSNYGRRAIF